jgi:hypothetical protein
MVHRWSLKGDAAVPSKKPAVAIRDVNTAIARLGGMKRTKAVAVLAQFGARCTPELRREDWRPVFDLANKELAKLGVPPAPRASPAPTASPALLQEFNVEGHPVQCHESDGHRLWHCDCAYFQWTLAIYNEGFCPHIVVAIGLALRDGTMELGFAVRPTSKKPG